ncbi:hypothetical protein K3495_g10666, partial [Podosphaera aphanis]
MAPLAIKRAVPPDPPDARNRVSKPKATLGKTGIGTKSARSTPYSIEARHKAKGIEKALNRVQNSAEEVNTLLDYPSDDSMNHAKRKADSTHENVLSPTECDTTKDQRSSAPLINAIKGLLLLLLVARIKVVLLEDMQVHMQVKILFPWVKAQKEGKAR